MCGGSVGEMLATEQDARRRIILQNDAYGKAGRSLVGGDGASVDTSEMKTSRCLIGKLKDCIFNCKPPRSAASQTSPSPPQRSLAHHWRLKSRLLI
jgi:hypothetical protein